MAFIYDPALIEPLSDRTLIDKRRYLCTVHAKKLGYLTLRAS